MPKYCFILLDIGTFLSYNPSPAWIMVWIKRMNRERITRASAYVLEFKELSFTGSLGLNSHALLVTKAVKL